MNDPVWQYLLAGSAESELCRLVVWLRQSNCVYSSYEPYISNMALQIGDSRFDTLTQHLVIRGVPIRN